MKIKTLIVLSALITSLTKAQPYGEYLYPHSGSILSSGSYNVQNPIGFLMAGYLPTSSGTQPNFHVDKTDVGGAFNSSTGEFSNSYDVLYQSGSCGSTLVQANNCTGVSIIESILTSPVAINYALVGATDEGCFFGTLDNTGSIVNNSFYRFPSNATNPSKPIIVETAGGGEYLIFGHYGRPAGGEMYILKVDPYGNILNSVNYNIATGVELVPKGLVLSPYMPAGVNEVVVVGEAIDFGGSAGYATKGFFARINEANLTLLLCVVPGSLGSLGGSSIDRFSSITVASNGSSGSDGFVVGGYSDSIAYYPLWMVKFDRVGNFIWNNVYAPNNDNSTVPDAVGVVEGSSTTYGLSYYAAVTSTAGVMAVRIDEVGNPFLAGPAIDNLNEFVYNPGFIKPGTAAISFVASGSPPDVGIHVYGTDDYIAGNDHYLVEAAFNGFSASLCTTNVYNNTMLNAPGPAWSPTVGFNPLQPLTLCTNIMINNTSLSPAQGIFCLDNTLNALGSNAKMLVTGTKDLNELSSTLSIFPNPATSKVELLFSVESNSNVSLSLINTLGQTVAKFDELINVQNSTQKMDIDLKALNLEKGIYFLNLQINNSVQQKKLIYLGD